MNITQQLYYDNPGEVLTHFVQRKPASDIEERSARSLAKLDVRFTFRLRWNPLIGFTEVIINDPGELEVDFYFKWLSRPYILMIQGEISHYFTSEQAEKDRSKIARINEIFAPLHAHPAIVIPFTMLSTQEDSDELIRNGLINGWTQQRYDEI